MGLGQDFEIPSIEHSSGVLDSDVLHFCCCAVGHVARGGSHSCHAHMQKIAGGGGGYWWGLPCTRSEGVLSLEILTTPLSSQVTWRGGWSCWEEFTNEGR